MKITEIIILISILTLIILSCSDSPSCENNTCLNGAICNEGICECTEWFSGENCEESLLPNKMILNSFVINSFPPNNPSPISFWDPLGNETTRRPDIYFALIEPSGNIKLTSIYSDYNISSEIPYTISWTLEYQGNYELKMFDSDGVGITGDQEMASFIFKPADLNTTTNLKPTFGSLYDNETSLLDLNCKDKFDL